MTYVAAGRKAVVATRRSKQSVVVLYLLVILSKDDSHAVKIYWTKVAYVTGLPSGVSLYSNAAILYFRVLGIVIAHLNCASEQIDVNRLLIWSCV